MGHLKTLTLQEAKDKGLTTLSNHNGDYYWKDGYGYLPCNQEEKSPNETL